MPIALPTTTRASRRHAVDVTDDDTDNSRNDRYLAKDIADPSSCNGRGPSIRSLFDKIRQGYRWKLPVAPITDDDDVFNWPYRADIRSGHRRRLVGQPTDCRVMRIVRW